MLAEAAYLLRQHAGLNPARVLAPVDRGVVATPFQASEHSGSLMRLLYKYADQNMQFADACLVPMSEITANCRVFTIDRTGSDLAYRIRRISHAASLVTGDAE